MTNHQGGPSRTVVFIRSCGGENRKGRPAFYDKTVCLASAVRSAREAVTPTELWFVNDGPIPAEREELMRAAGRIVGIDAGSNRGSYRATLALAASMARDDDLVYFGEDDYLYRPEAFEQLAQAAAAMPEVDYFSLYAGEPETRPADLPGYGGALSAPVTWWKAVSTTSSFAVRGSALHQDVRLLRLMPFTGGAFDHTTCLTLQGRYPFTWSELRADLLPLGAPAAERPRAVARGVARSVLGLRGLRRASRRRSLYAPDRDLATHVEEGCYDSADGWADLADRSRAWLAASRPVAPNWTEARLLSP